MFTSIKITITLLLSLLTTPGVNECAPEPASVNECAPGGCCTFVTKTGVHCDPVGPSGACESGSYLSCDAGECMEGSCRHSFGGNFSEECCSAGASS